MNQQEFFSEGQDQQPLESEIQAQPYYWSTRPKAKTGDVPKNEHPSTYEESIPPYSYRAQESASSTSRQEHPAYRAKAHQRRSEAAGGVFEAEGGDGEEESPTVVAGTGGGEVFVVIGPHACVRR